MPNRFEVAQRIRKARKAKGYSQGKLGDLAGCSRIQVNRWENAVHVPSELYRPILAKILDIDFTDLDREQDEQELASLLARADEIRARWDLASVAS